MTICKLKEENEEKPVIRPFSLTSVPRQHYSTYALFVYTEIH